MRAEDYAEHTDEVAGWGVRVTSFRAGEQYHATVENTAVGARIARGSGTTRESAEGVALQKAERRLLYTRVVAPPVE
jgi:hypothetical protein